MLVAFIVACIAAARLQKKGGGNSQSAGFAAMWTAILLVVISIVGTVVLRRVSTSDRSLLYLQSMSYICFMCAVSTSDSNWDLAGGGIRDESTDAHSFRNFC